MLGSSKKISDTRFKNTEKSSHWPFANNIRYYLGWSSLEDLRLLDIHEDMLLRQSIQHEEQEPFRTLLCYGMEELVKLLQYDRRLVTKRDACGATVIHVAYLLKKYDIGRRLVQLFPEEALLGYSQDAMGRTIVDEETPGQCEDDLLYTGENLLHITIIRRNHEQTRWLLDFYRDRKHSIKRGLFRLLTANATGYFFHERGSFYFGGYPLNFAVCSNDTEMFDIVVTYCQGLQLEMKYANELQGSRPDLLTIFQLDNFGNNALHLCVRHNLQDMYKHVTTAARTILAHEIKVAYEDRRREIGEHPTGILTITKTFSEGKIFGGHAPIETPVRCPVRGDVGMEAWLDENVEQKMKERMLWVLNNDLHTPLTQAAASLVKKAYEEWAPTEEAKKVKMLQFLIQESKEMRWSYGPVRCSLINLEGIELPYDLKKYHEDRIDSESRKKMKGVIEWLCVADSEKGIMLPELKTIVETRWERTGQATFLINCLVHWAITVLLTIISLFPYAVPASHPASFSAKVVTVTYPLTAALFVLILARDAYNLLTHGGELLFSGGFLRGAAVFEFWFRIFYMVSFILLCAFKIAESWDPPPDVTPLNESTSRIVRASTVCICISICCSWCYVFYFFMGFPSTAPFLITLYRIASKDIPYFLRFYCVLLVVFGCPLAVLTNNGTENAHYAIQHLLLVIWELIHETVQYSNNTYTQLSSDMVVPHLEWLYDLLHTGFYFCICITMLNLLIGMVSNTYAAYTSERNGLVLLERYNIMCGMAKTRSLDQHDILSKYATRSKSGGFKFQAQEKERNWEVDSCLKREGANNLESSKITLFVLDAQNDFHDMTHANFGGRCDQKRGSLSVPGAFEDSLRVADMITKNWQYIDEIIAVMDSHHPCHIAHPSYWKDSAGRNPEPFTEISLDDLKTRKWMPIDDNNREWASYYLKMLQKSDRFVHTIWPMHCLIGSRGHAIVEPINEAMKLWAAKSGKSVHYVMKGYNTKVEFYSAFQAEVSDPDDEGTLFNYDLLNRLRMSDRVIVCGQAMSHTVNFTLRDLVSHWPGDKSRILLLEDGCSSIAGEVSERASEKFLSDMVSEGVVLTSSDRVFLEIDGVQPGIYKRLSTKERDQGQSPTYPNAAIPPTPSSKPTGSGSFQRHPTSNSFSMSPSESTALPKLLPPPSGVRRKLIKKLDQSSPSNV